MGLVAACWMNVGVCLCRYDVGVLTHCGPDVDRLCATAKGKVHGNATVLKCLVENFSQTGVCVCVGAAIMCTAQPVVSLSLLFISLSAGLLGFGPQLTQLSLRLDSPCARRVLACARVCAVLQPTPAKRR